MFLKWIYWPHSLTDEQINLFSQISVFFNAVFFLTFLFVNILHCSNMNRHNTQWGLGQNYFWRELRFYRYYRYHGQTLCQILHQVLYITHSFRLETKLTQRYCHVDNRNWWFFLLHIFPSPPPLASWILHSLAAAPATNSRDEPSWLFAAVSET